MLFETLVGNLLLAVFGNPLLIGIFLMIFFYLFGLALRLSPEIQLMLMFISTALIVSIYIPGMAQILLLVVGTAVGVWLFYRLFGR